MRSQGQAHTCWARGAQMLAGAAPLLVLLLLPLVLLLLLLPLVVVTMWVGRDSSL